MGSNAAVVMRIAVVHSYYSSRQPSGENIAVDSQVAMLRDSGHEVLLLAQRTDELERARGYALGAAWHVTTGSGPSPTRQLRDFRPEVVHVHNLFPNWGTSWLKDWPGPIVATLHNFRPVCAAATLSREGVICTLCPDGSRTASLLHACYKGSRAKTLPLTIRNRGGALSDAVVKRADRLILLSPRAQRFYADFGLPQSRMTLIPNGVADVGLTGTTESRSGWLFAGRLSAEKGIQQLLTNWPSSEPLDIVGDGELTPWVRDRLPPVASLLGPLPRDELLRRVRRSRGVLIPSVCPESALPLIAIEALASGTPLVARAGTTAADAVAQSGAGSIVERDDWAAGLSSTSENWHDKSEGARAYYEREHTPRRWLDRLMNLYRSL